VLPARFSRLELLASFSPLKLFIHHQLHCPTPSVVHFLVPAQQVHAIRVLFLYRTTDSASGARSPVSTRVFRPQFLVTGSFSVLRIANICVSDFPAMLLVWRWFFSLRSELAGLAWFPPGFSYRFGCDVCVFLVNFYSTGVTGLTLELPKQRLEFSSFSLRFHVEFSISPIRCLMKCL
jgi:hypothetical protein